MRRWIVILCAACGSNNGGSITYDQYAAQIESDYCSYLVRCGLFPDVATCESANHGVDFAPDPSTTAAIDMGRIAFDGTKAASCLAAFTASSCDQTMTRGTPAACTNIVSGTVGSGGECALDAECISQACEVPNCTMACCQGTCAGGTAPSELATGMPCSTDDECVSGDFCDSQMGACEPFHAAGSACNDSFACALGYACAGAPEACMTLPGTGSACPNSACANIGDHCGSAGICVHDGLPGDACTTNADCSPFFLCDTTTMQCAQGPGIGSSCEATQCFDANTYCTSETGSASPVCAPAGSDGAPCNFTDQCLSGHCDGSACDTPAVCI